MDSLHVLLCLGQLPQDPASGAARCLLTTAEMLAGEGFTVRSLGVTATEDGRKQAPLDWLRDRGFDVRVDRGFMKTRADRPVYRFTHRGVDHAVVDTKPRRAIDWEQAHDRTFNRLFDGLLSEFKPDLLLTYGGILRDHARLRRARSAGCKVVFGLYNTSYRDRRWFDEVDAVLTPSAFISDSYRARFGIESTPLPTQINVEDVVAEPGDRPFVTFINPSVEKGVFFYCRLAEELGRRRPDIPLLVIESRGTAGMLLAAGRAGGFDLRRHKSLMVSPSTPKPRDIFAVTRVLLVPSVWQEPSGRVAAEALINGIPPIVSDRGGLPETCAGAGFIAPLPENLTLDTRTPVSPMAVQPWTELVERLIDDEAFYQQASQAAASAGRLCHPERLAPRYADFFRAVRHGEAPLRGPADPIEM